MDWILGRLALGNLEDGRNATGVNIVLNVCETAYEWPSGVPGYHIPFADGMAIPTSTIATCFLLMRTWLQDCRYANQRLLVHCLEGRSRAPSIVIGYLVWCGMAWDEAEHWVQQRRPQVDPYPATLQSVKDYLGIRTWV